MELGPRIRVLAGALIVASCGGRPRAPQPAQSPSATLLPSAGAKGIVAGLRTPALALPPGPAEAFHAVPGGGFEPRFAASSHERVTARVLLPERSTAPLRIEDPRTGMRVGVTLEGAREAVPQAADGYLVYVRGHISGATVLHRALPSGSEDLLAFPERPKTPAVVYRVAVGQGVGGLRLIENTLEMLDAGGAPRLRVSSPYVVGADGVRTDATLAVEGCAFDTSPAPPWGRPVTAPGSDACTLRVSWPDRAVAYPAVLDPRWSSTSTMSTPRQGHTATLMSNNKVLVAGGANGSTPTATAEVFDPATGTFGGTQSMSSPRQLHTAIQLPTSSNTTSSGRVLVAGGLNGNVSQTVAQLYSPTAGTWGPATALNTARHQHTATVMSNGQVLVAGGVFVNNNTPTVLQTAAVWNPGTSGGGTWTATGNMAVARRSHTATLLSTSNSMLNNKVMVVGGNTGGTTSTLSVQLFDGTTWSPGAALGTPREGHTATLLANGKVLLAGGVNGTGAPIAAALLFDPTSGLGSWGMAGNMSVGRRNHTATLLASGILANGQVLVAAGSDGTNTLATAELFNGTSSWTTAATGTSLTAVQSHTATLLPNGTVLVAGGANGSTVANWQIYDPSSGLTCTTGSQCATGFCASGVCCDKACGDTQCSSCNQAGNVGICLPKNTGLSCSDGNACTLTDTCQNGACTGTSKVCTASDQCHLAGTCNPANGTCSNPTASNGTTCSDGDGCTLTDTCQNGTCTSGSPKTCTASDQCHVAGTCNPADGTCSNPVVSNGTTCNDGNACTQTDTCQNGACTGGNPKTCTASDQCHFAGTCSPADGTCSNPSAANGTACSDGNLCTQTDTCQAGVCAGANPIVCGTDRCHPVGTCQPATGVCYTPYVNQASCPFLAVSLYQPVENQANSVATGIDDLGEVVGWSFGFGAPSGIGYPAVPFYVTTATPTALAFPGTSDRVFPSHVNASGFVVATGGTLPGEDDWNYTVLYRPDHSFTMPLRARSQPSAIGNALGSNGEPAIVGSLAIVGGAVGIWSFDGDTNDRSIPGGRNFPPPSPATYVAGRVGQALQLAPSTVLSQPLGGAGVNAGLGLSASAWVKPTGACPSSPAPLLQRGSFFSLGLMCGPGGAIAATGTINLDGSASSPQLGPLGSLVPGQWNHVVMSWNEHFARFYVNGALVGTVPREGPLTGDTETMTIGPGLTGAIDEVLLYATPLSAADVARLYAGDTLALYQSYGSAIFRHRNGETQVIAPLYGTPFGSITTAYAVDEAGEMVGTATLGDGQQHALYFTDADGLRDLNTLLPPGSGWFLTYALGINNQHQIVGRGEHGGQHRMFRFDVAAGQIRDLGLLPSPNDNPQFYRIANAINDAGHVVGTSSDQGPLWSQRAIVYTDTLGLTDLNSLVDPQSQWTLREAFAINNSDDIVGWASNDSFTSFRAFKLSLNGEAVGVCLGKPDGTECDDENRCTQGDACQAGACVSGSETICLAQDQCHLPGTCSPITGACSNPRRPDGPTCHDRQGRIEAESFDAAAGFVPDAGGMGPVTSGAWLAFDGVDFGASGNFNRVSVSILASPGDRHVEVRLDSASGPLIADLLTLPSTLDRDGIGPQSTVLLAPVSGLHRVVLVATAADEGIIDWFSFDGDGHQTIVSSFPFTYHYRSPVPPVDLDNLPPVTDGVEDDTDGQAWLSATTPVDIPPGDFRLVGLTLQEAVVVFGKATWTPASTTGVVLSVVDNSGAVIATGQPCGTQLNCAQVNTAGALSPQNVAIKVSNTSGVTVTMQQMSALAMRMP